MKLNDETKIIGVTGRIATGKSSLAAAVSDCGYKLIDADSVYHELLRSSKAMQDDLIARFGSFDRKQIFKKVSNNRNALKNLNEITHPYVTAEIKKTMKTNNGGKWVLDVPIPVKDGFLDLCDFIFVTDCSIVTQKNRLVKRNKITEEEAINLVNMQMSRAEYIRLADCIINTEDIKSSELYTVVKKIIT